jgi:hypothetical protein
VDSRKIFEKALALSERALLTNIRRAPNSWALDSLPFTPRFHTPILSAITKAKAPALWNEEDSIQFKALANTIYRRLVSRRKTGTLHPKQTTHKRGSTRRKSATRRRPARSTS